MAGAKLIVLYPQPTDVQEFDRVYQEEHLPLAVEKIKGFNRAVITRVLGSPEGKAPYHLMVELHFPSMEALRQTAASAGAQEAIAHAVQISTGGPPVVMVAEEETVTP